MVFNLSTIFGPSTARTEPTPPTQRESPKSQTAEPATSTSSVPPQVSTEANRLIRLQAGERIFTTHKDTLMESEYFKRQLSGRWDQNRLPDGSWFIDGNPDLFEHILQYLRRGVFPLFFDVNKGHDHHLYQALLAEARYLVIPRLETWLENRCYLKGIVVKTTVERRILADAGLKLEDVGGVRSLEFYPQFRTSVVPHCLYNRAAEGYSVVEKRELVVVTKRVHVSDKFGKGWHDGEELEKYDSDDLDNYLNDWDDSDNSNAGEN